jgi:hypothetical protein
MTSDNSNNPQLCDITQSVNQFASNSTDLHDDETCANKRPPFYLTPSRFREITELRVQLQNSKYALYYYLVSGNKTKTREIMRRFLTFLGEKKKPTTG